MAQLIVSWSLSTVFFARTSIVFILQNLALLSQGHRPGQRGVALVSSVVPRLYGFGAQTTVSVLYPAELTEFIL